MKKRWRSNSDADTQPAFDSLPLDRTNVSRQPSLRQCLCGNILNSSDLIRAITHSICHQDCCRRALTPFVRPTAIYLSARAHARAHTHTHAHTCSPSMPVEVEASTAAIQAKRGTTMWRPLSLYRTTCARTFMCMCANKGCTIP
eukprot:scaffold67242_cov23-Tisochrysis_lutea.AAC.1